MTTREIIQTLNAMLIGMKKAVRIVQANLHQHPSNYDLAPHQRILDRMKLEAQVVEEAITILAAMTEYTQVLGRCPTCDQLVKQ